MLNQNNLYIYFELLHFIYLFIYLFILSLIYPLFVYLLPYVFRFCTIDLLHVFYYTLIMCMLLWATSTHFKWELMLLSWASRL